jgi:hypothetical protein
MNSRCAFGGLPNTCFFFYSNDFLPWNATSLVYFVLFPCLLLSACPDDIAGQAERNQANRNHTACARINKICWNIKPSKHNLSEILLHEVL